MAVQKAKIKKFAVEKATDETLDFELGDETFHCRAKLNGITLINFVRGVQKANEESEANEESKGIETIDLLLTILQDAMGEKEYRRFENYVSRPDLDIPMETIMEIAQYLVGEYTQSPSEAS